MNSPQATSPKFTPEFLRAGAANFLSGKGRWTAAAVAAVIAVALFAIFSSGGGQPQGRFVTEEATTGKLVVSISA
ncbi:MAG: hypothetical protein WBP72_11295, partial [Rhodocyclaceae bacterium]